MALSIYSIYFRAGARVFFKFSRLILALPDLAGAHYLLDRRLELAPPSRYPAAARPSDPSTVIACLAEKIWRKKFSVFFWYAKFGLT